MKKLLITICGRAGSKGFKNKNLKTFCGRPLVYYSLAIGHHLGVIDCLEAALTCPWDEYLAWIATLEAGSEARRKMEGVPKYGEIVIDINHVPMLANAFDKARAAQTSQQQEWSTMLLSMLHDIHQENAIYLMVRRLRD